MLAVFERGAAQRGGHIPRRVLSLQVARIAFAQAHKGFISGNVICFVRHTVRFLSISFLVSCILPQRYKANGHQMERMQAKTKETEQHRLGA